MAIRAFKVDSFTAEPFAGNPAGVCLLTDWLPDPLLQSIAAENNLAETAFIVQRDEQRGGGPDFFGVFQEQRAVAGAVMRISFQPLQLNPQFFAYGSLPIYLARISSAAVGLIDRTANSYDLLGVAWQYRFRVVVLFALVLAVLPVMVDQVFSSLRFSRHYLRRAGSGRWRLPEALLDSF